MTSRMKNPSSMTRKFSTAPQVGIPRSTFKRISNVKGTVDSGDLIPIYCDEFLPGDTFNLKMSQIIRMATPIKPIMDNLFADVFFFACPNRILWENWAKFMGEQDDPGDSTDYTIPTVFGQGSTHFAEGSLADYMGLPTTGTIQQVSALHHNAYNLIWNEWFRCQSLQDSAFNGFTAAASPDSEFPIRKRCKPYDYFTSALPWPQKLTDVDIPLAESVPIKGMGKVTQTFPTATPNVYETGGSGQTQYLFGSVIDPAGGNTQIYVEQDSNNAGYPNIRADLSSASGTINSLREAFQLQRMLERDARGGTRYTEILSSHFRVSSPDGRLQRPEFLGGGTVPINISPVAQTTEKSATGTTVQGNLSAIGYAQSTGISWTKSFVEHGVILGLMSIRADLSYQQSLHRMWSRETK